MCGFASDFSQNVNQRVFQVVSYTRLEYLVYFFSNILWFDIGRLLASKIHLSTTVALTVVRSKAMVLLLFNMCLLLPQFFLAKYYIVLCTFLFLHSSHRERDRRLPYFLYFLLFAFSSW